MKKLEMTVSQNKFMRAGVPRTCWSLSCRDRGQENITDWANEQKRRSTEREGMLSAYVQLPAFLTTAKHKDAYTFGQETVELLARQAVLAGLPVKVVLFHHLLHALKHPEQYRDRDIDPESPARLTMFDILGHGVIVVPQLPTPEQSSTTELCQYREAIEFLLTHVYEGGALVIGGTEELTKRLASAYPPSFERLLLGNSDFFGTNT